MNILKYKRHIIDVSSNDVNKGEVTQSTTHCGTGGTITISASPSSPSTFTQWSDGNIDNPRQIVVTQDIQLQAIFSGEQTGGGALPGIFYIKETNEYPAHYIQFSPSILFYDAITNQWQFSDKQWYIVNTAYNIEGLSDKFQWGANGIDGRNPIDSGNNYYNGDLGDLNGTSVDWGYNNIQGMGSNFYRTCQHTEINRLRAILSKKDYTITDNDGITYEGFLVYPNYPEQINPTGNSIDTPESLLAEIEATNAVCIPYVGSLGNCIYWANKDYSSTHANMWNLTQVGQGRSKSTPGFVRLVHDVQI